MTGPTYPLSVLGSVAEPVVLVDPSTGEPYAAGGGGGGGSLSAKANAASQASTEGATADPISMDLHRSIRMLPMGTDGNPLDPAAPVPISQGGPLSVGGVTVTPTFSTTRPANVTPYAIGGLAANNTTAASVVPFSWTSARSVNGSGMLRRLRLKKSTPLLTNASFRMHFYSQAPASVTNGDGGAWLTSMAGYLGSIDVTMDKAFTDGAEGVGIPAVGSEINFVCSGGNAFLYGLLEARAAYVPGSSEVTTGELEILEN